MSAQRQGDGMNGAPAIPQVDPLRFPLRGSHLIEASAGTGKTWTIAALYVRLVLGHGGQDPRLPTEILVLTFTEAAAQELRDRIRARLAEAAVWFAGEARDEAGHGADHGAGHGADHETGHETGHAADPFLASLRREWPRDRWAGCARTLDLAAQSMDEAAISTIHAWCARVLQEHAFDSGSLFEQRLEPDLGAEIRQTAWDYWRAHVAPLAPDDLAEVLAVWPGPDALLGLSGLLTRESLPEAADESLSAVLARHRAVRRERLAALKAPWIEAADALEDWLVSLGKDTKIRPADLRRWMQALRTWARDPELAELDLKTGWDRLTPQGIQDKWQGEEPAPQHPASAALVRLRADLAALPGARASLLRHALAWMARRLRQALSSAALLGFDGLLGNLDAALEGAAGARLAQTLRRQFPVVLIDEFQDTDPVQYRIFDRVYRVADDDPDTALVFIGDPKQSIYGFRGADVHTYLRAGRACARRVQTLGRNYRSSVAMVAAVNRCFALRGAQAFPTGLPDVGIAFHPVQAQGRAERWEVLGRPAPAMSACWIEPAAPDKPLSSTQYEQDAAALCARRVAETLALGRRGAAGMREDARWTPVRPADVAILVNTHAEARSVRQALARAGVRSVYLSERDSVYESPQTAELALWLDACAHPEDERAVRAALAAPALGLDWQALDRLVEDERAWDAQVERFQAYRQIWRQRGVLPMLRRLLHDFDVPARLLADGYEGERRLTDFLHLAELLQQAAAHLDGEQAVLRYLHRQAQSPQGEDGRRLRLESDEGLVRVVTVHKSKGLEYPLVFLPFVCKARPVKAGEGPYLLPGAAGREWVMEADAQALLRLDGERLGEDVRKLYVALTRARHAVWMALGPLKAGGGSAIGHLLGADLRAAWDGLARAHPGLMAWDAASADDAGEAPFAGAPAEAPEALGEARRLAAPAVGQPWWISSYSALCLADAAAPETAAEDVLREGRQADPAPAPRAAEAAPVPLASGLRDFPRGSEAGTFLHGLLEWAARRGFRDLDAEARDLIARRCAVRGWEAHIDALHDWLLRLARTPWRPALPGDPVLRLDSLQACLPEMEFWLPAQRVDIGRLDGLLRRATFGGAARPALAAGRLNGMFKGFIDLVLQADGRYYLIDYKSNDLGARAADYAPEALEAAMCASRYDAQMLMYVLALHRQLRARLADYDYARHMGGALYLFLRGQEAPGQGLVALRPERGLVEALDALFDGADGEAGDD
ncbi:exodeoxyribonuclease V subunit beta [Castellaniella defragrans]|uniref:RecBCD enzyme subunit RecB n=3 Tax=Castellaniella defragrans TaxID=75697 RepID=A0A7W9WNL1_CASDE|nr:exodeoxyribonuclease V subunit beta [Castellaniella defragrans]MBB6083673.1 exodeoxyribonuclease V beta subunit [Castellaniella defragrans]